MTEIEWKILEDRWARYVVEGAPDACWEWRGYRQSNGYGWINSSKIRLAAHRASLIISGLTVPPNMDVCHTCDNRACVNPRHLYIGTRRQNMADCTARDRHNKPIGEKHWCAKLIDEDIRRIRDMRICGISVTKIAAMFRVHHATVSRIARREWRGEVS